ncbi:MAG TPA: APC family permease [Candidatus Acidoferrales bacterium]|nr:APC family permease [Candidatus Acidoferrales bacterium]
MFSRLKELLIGSPLETASLHEQRLSKKAALAVLASDNLSSTAYATEEILLALAAGAAAGLAVPLYYAIPIGVAIGLLTLIVVISYGQTIRAYPTGGGAYTVAKENLGITSALIAGSSLLIDYSLTVAVSITEGIAAITSAIPPLYEQRVPLCLLALGIILLLNLRGVRESAAAFAGPVYAFIVAAYLLVIGGLLRYGVVHPPTSHQAGWEMEGAVWNFALVFLLLRAFASGCAALTGIEAVTQGVKVFRPPVARNANIVLYVLATLLGTLFLGITVLAYLYEIVPREGQTVLSQLGRTIFGAGPIYYFIQVSTMAILILAANTSFTGFPRLASVMAEDRFVPRQLANLGDRLVFSNGILMLSGSAAFLIVMFDAQVHNLIPLYMVGVFTAFTLSQAGMVVHWRRSQEPGKTRGMIVNALGALTTGIVLLIVGVVKFAQGAWLIIVAIPALVLINRRVRHHYYMVGRALSLADYEKPKDLQHTAVVPVAGMNKMVLGAIEYARSISEDVIAVTVNVGGADPEKLMEEWQAWAPDVPLVVLNSPYRAIQRPLLRFIDEVESWRKDDVITVVIPEFITKQWWHHFLHNQTTLFLKAALLFKPRLIVTSVPHHLRH